MEYKDPSIFSLLLFEEDYHQAELRFMLIEKQYNEALSDKIIDVNRMLDLILKRLREES